MLLRPRNLLRIVDAADKTGVLVQGMDENQAQ